MANEYAVNQADLQAVADAIREKGGTSDALTFPGGFVDAVGAIQAGGGGGETTNEDMLVMRALTEYTNNRVNCAGNNAFRSYTALKSVTMENCTKVDSDAFNECTSLETINMPNLEYASTRAFRNTGLKNAYFPKLRTIVQAFGNNAKLETLILPACPSVTAFASSCALLRLCDFASATSIAASSFSGCTSLKNLILRAGSVVSLANINAFTNTPFASGGTGGTVYVPSALIESYKTATNWSTLYAAGTCTFAAIEGSEYE